MSTVEYEITPNKESVDVAAIIDSQNNNNLANLINTISY